MPWTRRDYYRSGMNSRITEDDLELQAIRWLEEQEYHLPSTSLLIL